MDRAPPDAMTRYLPLERYALVGDCRTAALVSDCGSIDWLCAPAFDSPSVFGRVLDADRGGHFSIRPDGRFGSRSAYMGHSAALETTFCTESGTFVLTDFMPLAKGPESDPFGAPLGERQLVRAIEGVDGAVDVCIDYRPAPQYGGIQRPGRTWRRTIRAGERWAYVVHLDREARLEEHPQGAENVLEETLRFWRGWHAGCRYRGPYYEQVMRSLATLKLLIHAPTGGMVAAPTTSLPEEIGGVRNWDYRYTWIRDAAFGFHALFHAGHPEDARRFMRWVCETALRCEPGALQIMYGLRGERDLDERTLEHLEGYRRSRPVRIGNHASTQFQLDVYGELLDCFEMVRTRAALQDEEVRALWPAFRGQVDAVASRWREPDSGIWEMRSEPRHFVYSKVMAWVALDRGIRAAEAVGLSADLPRWRLERESVRREVLEKGYDERLGTFVQHYGAQTSDAANLLLPIVGFIDARDPRMLGTIEFILRTLLHDGLVYRYLRTDDGLPGGEATFAACSFWLVENLAMCGRRDEAIRLFERLLGRASPHGLYAEELEPLTGAHLGNFPQALTHIALTNAALALERTKGT